MRMYGVRGLSSVLSLDPPIEEILLKYECVLEKDGDEAGSKLARIAEETSVVEAVAPSQSSQRQLPR